MDIRKLILRIPGEWEDAWLYRENLLVWDCGGALYYLPVERLLESVALAADHHHKVLAEHLILRSSRKSTSEIRDMLAIPSVRRELFAPLKDAPEVIIQINPADLRRSAVEPIPGNITDTVAYGNRIFATSDEGIYETQFSPRHEQASPLLQVVDNPTTAIVAGNGIFAASLGEHGLRSREIRFGDGIEWIQTAKDSKFETLAEYSRTVTRASMHLMNYGESPLPEFIRASTRRERRDKGFTESIVFDFDNPYSIEPLLERALGLPSLQGNVTNGSRFEVLGNANYRLLLQVGPEVQVLNIRAFRNEPFQLKKTAHFDIDSMMTHPIGRAMSTQALRSGFLVEHTSGVHILSESGAIELADELVVQARTYPNSRRYVDTVTLVKDRSLDLIGFIDLST